MDRFTSIQPAQPKKIPFYHQNMLNAKHEEIQTKINMVMLFSSIQTKDNQVVPN